jgi:DNA-binding FrmR family transcriptional regulator
LSLQFDVRYKYHTPGGYRDAIIMGHTVRDKAKLLARIKRIRGQVEAVERALESEKGCNEVLLQIVAARGAINALMSEVIEDHVRTHIASPSITSQSERAKGADELIEVIRSYLK